MGEIIVFKAVKREPGYLYYVDGEGNVCRAIMRRGGRPKKNEKENPSKK